MIRIVGGTRLVQTRISQGYLFGTTKVAGQIETSVRRLVQIFSTENSASVVFPTNVLVAWFWSDENGDWELRGLDPAKKYHAIAYDHTGQYDPVIKMNLTPTVD